MPPCAAFECERTGWTLLMIPTDTPSSAAARAARCPARPAPITSTSCVGTSADSIEAKSDFAVGFRRARPSVWDDDGHARRQQRDNPLPRPRDQDRGRLVLVPRPLPLHLLALGLLRRSPRPAQQLDRALPAGGGQHPRLLRRDPP